MTLLNIVADNNQDVNRLLVQQWKRASSELQRIHDEELERYVYDAELVDSMLDTGLLHAEPRFTSGLVEMQRIFRKWQ